jgi:hypothetical protein
LHLFIPPIGKLDASGIDNTAALVGIEFTIYGIFDGDRLAAIKGAMFTVCGTIEVG